MPRVTVYTGPGRDRVVEGKGGEPEEWEVHCTVQEGVEQWKLESVQSGEKERF